MLHIVQWLTSCCCENHYIFNCKHSYFALFCLSSFPSFTLTFKSCSPDIKCASYLPTLVVHYTSITCKTPSHLHLCFCVLLCSFLPPSFSPPTLTLVTMPSLGSHTVKLQHPPSATAAQISATPPLGTR